MFGWISVELFGVNMLREGKLKLLDNILLLIVVLDVNGRVNGVNE